ncbi:TonB-dependent receptor [Catenovulum agarivorans]|uniref:TonB-dependent receptor n=1 Tax=Catenovulum agarivorans TaxID=1172192 RepID=UPI0002F0DC20|nr:TonB-dependent receptor [Catenovulum agarivorans]
MNKTRNKLSWCISTILCANFAGLSTAAMAQDETKAEEQSIETIEVTGLRRQLHAAAQIERTAKNVVTVMTADDVGSFPDQTLAESLSRLAGVAVEGEEGEGRFISVRGLQPAFVQVTINNAQLGASDPNGKRSVALDVVPGDLFQEVSVGKTLLPDTDHDSLGAKVDLRPLSAFRRGKGSSANISLRTQYKELAEQFDPDIRADFTKIFNSGDSRFGIAAAVSYSDFAVQGDQLRSTSGNGIEKTLSAEQKQDNIADDEQVIWAIQELDQRMERGSRERVGGTLVLDFEPNDAWRLQLSGIYGTLDDDDIRVQQEVALRGASDSETIESEKGHGIFSDVNIERQMFFVPTKETTQAIHFEGDYLFGNDDWKLSFAVDHSTNDFEFGQARRGTWILRDTIVDATWSATDAEYTFLGTGDFDKPDKIDYTFVPTPADFELVQIGAVRETRHDEINSFNIDLQHDFYIGDSFATFKAGIKSRERERGYSRGARFESINTNEEKEAIESLGIPTTLDGLPTFVPETGFDINGGIPGGAVFPTIEFAREYLETARAAVGIEPDATTEDYQAGEDTDAAYAMLSVELLPELEVIAGVRYEKTQYSATGLTDRSIRLDRLNPESDQNDEIITEDLADTSAFETYRHSYDNYFPAVHIRYDYSDEVVARLSLSKGQVRPGFGEANGIIEETYEFLEQSADVSNECSGYTSFTFEDNTYSVCSNRENYTIKTEGGNPFLKPQIANQIDFNLGWYPSAESSLTASFYYKDIKDYIIRVSTSNSELFPLLGGSEVDPLTGLAATEFIKPVNATSAKLFGAELNGRYQFKSLPAPFDNFLVTANLAFIDGETSSPFIANGAKMSLLGQADFIGNMALIYEVDKFNVQLSAKYRTERLVEINADVPERTVYDEPAFNLGISARYDISKKLRVFGNIQNITNETAQRYFTGDERSGRLVNRRGEFGRTMRVGVDIRF